MLYCSKENNASYFPPMLGNGDVSFAVDPEGTLNYTARDFGVMHAFDGVLFRAGRRMSMRHDAMRACIMGLGKWIFLSGDRLCEWEQELMVERGLVRSDCRYRDGLRVHSECFLCREDNLYVLTKRFENVQEDRRVGYRFTLCGYDDYTSDALHVREVTVSDCRADMAFEARGMDIYRGIITLRLGKKADITTKDNEIELWFDVCEGEEISLYLGITDDLDGVNPDEELAAMHEKTDALGAAGLAEETAKKMGEYFSIGYVKTEDERLNSIYKTALYHMLCYTTRRSIPVGINNVAWNSNFFAFDEYYGMLGLMGAGQLSLAERVPAFRLEKCLDKAIARVGFAGAKDAACYPWQTSEYGEELATPGRWYEHIFHMAVVALGAYELYEYTGDIEKLRRYYPLIRSAAKFYTRFSLYEFGGEWYVGKCCDLERLGGGIFNPFMTSCGVIRTLEICAASAKLLDADEDYAAECREKASSLRRTLPRDDERYLPYVGCEVNSIAVFAGKFPFDVLESGDEKMMAAWNKFLSEQDVYGNMYAMGKKLSPWYACWEAEGFARTGQAKEAKASLELAYASVGCFDEMFEINEESVKRVPWFMTAAGIFLSAVHDMLIRTEGDCITICPAYPIEGASLDCRLAVKGGLMLEFRVEKGKLCEYRLIGDASEKARYRVYFDHKLLP